MTKTKATKSSGKRHPRPEKGAGGPAAGAKKSAKGVRASSRRGDPDKDGD